MTLTEGVILNIQPVISIQLAAGAIAWPSFDHAVGDPVPEDVQILPEHKVVLVEGNYVLMGMQPAILVFA